MILFSDFDNTLYLHGNPEGTERNLAAVKKFRAAGNKFCLASGRSYSSVLRVIPELVDYVDYLVLDNGAVCTDANGEKKFDFLISAKTTDEMVRFIEQEFPDDDVCNVFYYDMTEHPDYDGDVTKFRCWTRSKEVSERIIVKLLAKFGGKIKAFVASVARPSGVEWLGDEYDSFVDVAPIDAGKERAIAKLVEMVAPNEKVIVVGDSSNDNDMIVAFDGYAVENAEPETLAIVRAGHVVSTVADLLMRNLGK